VGRGGGVFSFLHVDDAASAAVSALQGAPGVYNVVDDEPATGAEWIPAFCAEVGAPTPRRIPAWLAALLAGRYAAASLQRAPGSSNRGAKSTLGWRPRQPTWRAGFLTGQDFPKPAL